jgi:hypothetical protein
MADPVSLFTGTTALFGAGAAASAAYDALNPDLPAPARLPAEVRDIDAQSQREYMKKRMAGRKGRQSTILGSKLGGNATGGKTVLG